jgi:hypothetical protein
LRHPQAGAKALAGAQTTATPDVATATLQLHQLNVQQTQQLKQGETLRSEFQEVLPALIWLLECGWPKRSRGHF